jgi:hypothetical protein
MNITQFEANETSMEQERKKSLAIISNLGESTSKKRDGDRNVVNVRKAIRATSNSKGSRALLGSRHETPQNQRSEKNMSSFR